MNAYAYHLKDALRAAAIEQRTLVVAGPGARPFRQPVTDLHIDATNLLCEVDASVGMVTLARALRARGYALPLARPLLNLTVAQTLACHAYITDAMLHCVDALTVDGDAFASFRAPRAALGPSLSHTLCARPPLAIAVRAVLRVVPIAHTAVWHHHFDSVAAAARFIVDVTTAARAFAVDAFGGEVICLGATGASPAVHQGERVLAVDGFAHVGGRYHSSVSIAPGDAASMAAALECGERVATAPLMGRAAILRRAHTRLAVQPVNTGVASLVRACVLEAAAAHDVLSRAGSDVSELRGRAPLRGA